MQPREQHYYDGFLKLTVKYINSTKLRNVFVRRIRDDDDTDDDDDNALTFASLFFVFTSISFYYSSM